MTPHPPVISAMMIRRPAKDVYEHFVDPFLLTQYWLSHSSARLEVGEKILWRFKIKGAEDTIFVKALELERRILITWDQGVEVEWTFHPRREGETFVSIEVRGLRGTR